MEQPNALKQASDLMRTRRRTSPKREHKATFFGPKLSAFLAAIRVMPNVTRAAIAAKMNKSQHYAKLKSSPDYAAAFQQALEVGYDAISDVAVMRATEGWEETVVYQSVTSSNFGFLNQDPTLDPRMTVMVLRMTF